MANPIIEQITQDLVDAVETVTVANGYNQTLIVERPVSNDEAIAARDNLAVVREGNPSKMAQEDTSSAYIMWEHGYHIDLYAAIAENDATPLMTRLHKMRADVEKAVLVDPYRGELAIDTRVEEPEYWVDRPGIVGVTVVIVVQFRTLIGDPYTQ